jgi:hypothetical protein
MMNATAALHQHLLHFRLFASLGELAERSLAAL